MKNLNLVVDKYYKVIFADGEPVDFKFKNENNGSLLCEKKTGETFFLDTMEPFDKVIEIESW